ncbi:CPBP family intramembrane metalloprotease [Puteibacter caeruleilacunae]|nr:CPBP family intramembrane metalloprotease [Puteibacter caeruleilacunae]
MTNEFTDRHTKYYPGILQGIHLVILYIFLQTVINFPIAIFDYYNDSDWLHFPPIKLAVTIGTNLFILFYGLYKAKQPISEVFPMKWFNPVVVVPITIYLIGAHYYLGIVNVWVDQTLPPPNWFYELFARLFENDYGFWGTAFKVALVAPVIEEMIFRGFIMHGFMRNYSKFTAIFVSALMFALFHLNPWQFPATFTLGLLLGWIMVRTQNILLCIIGHALNNFLVLLSIEYYEQINETAKDWIPPGQELAAYGTLIIAGLLLIFLTTFKRKKST